MISASTKTRSSPAARGNPTTKIDWWNHSIKTSRYRKSKGHGLSRFGSEAQIQSWPGFDSYKIGLSKRGLACLRSPRPTFGVSFGAEILFRRVDPKPRAVVRKQRAH